MAHRLAIHKDELRAFVSRWLFIHREEAFQHFGRNREVVFRQVDIPIRKTGTQDRKWDLNKMGPYADVGSAMVTISGFKCGNLFQPMFAKEEAIVQNHIQAAPQEFPGKIRDQVPGGENPPDVFFVAHGIEGISSVQSDQPIVERKKDTIRRVT